jgi:hypothetical protein
MCAHRSQVDHILVERLQGTWQKGLLAQARGASADLAHKLDEHDAAQKRYLGHKCARCTYSAAAAGGAEHGACCPRLHMLTRVSRGIVSDREADTQRSQAAC